MRDTAGFLASCADVLTELCVFYMIAAIFLCPSTWGVAMGWMLLCALACAVVFAVVLKTPRTTPVLVALTVGLGCADLGIFMLVSSTPLAFGYCLMMAVGAGMAVGMPLYYALHRPKVHIHLSHLDVLVIFLFVLLLCRQALNISAAAVTFTVVIAFLDAGTAVGLRMTGQDGAGGEDAVRACMVALGAAVGVFVLVGLMAMLFSRSADVTGSVLAGIGAFFSVIGGGVERFFAAVAALFAREQHYESLTIEGEIPSVQSLEQSGGTVQLAVNTTAVGIILVVAVLAIAVTVALVLRGRRISMASVAAPVAHHTTRKRLDSPIKRLWHTLICAIRFRWTAFRQRNTPGGLLIRLERLGRRRKKPRQQGETMRQYITRMDAGGGLGELADALDMEFYGGMSDTLSPRRCRELRRYMIREVRHG